MEKEFRTCFFVSPCVRKKLPVAGSVDTKVYKRVE
ncbi:hypothetical protein DORLON_01031 [Dorea longicatena DSM 13814]|uniref:Uncharacterized protein n=1 Tax=Dorea longicatena DSM 13814 TaxID=411462 RepID=A6BFF9_9FIRM|nr:hypothetical protein DORLON_01031 [Dorea longicatena DSM 13814]